MSYWDDEDFAPQQGGRSWQDWLAQNGGGIGGGVARPAVEQPTVEQPAPGVSAAPAAPAQPAAPGYAPGANAGQKVTLLGFDSSKLEDPNSGSVAGSKYTSAAKAFYNGLKQDVGLSRGGLDNMLGYLRSNGFQNAKAVGDDKIDFGDGNGPVDVVRSDGQIVFQNTTGNPTWEAGHGGPQAPAGGGAGLSLGSIGSSFAPPPAMSVGQSGHLGGSFSPFVYEDFKAPDAFKAPTIEDAQNDPGYAFAQQQGQRAITNMASKHGNLVSGEFAKGMADYNQGLATTHYGDVYNRAASAYDRNYGNAFGANQANNAGRLGAFTANTNADLGYGNLGVAQQNANTGAQSVANQYSLGMANVGLGYHTADQSYDLGLRNNALGYTEAGNNYSLGLGNQNLGWANYGLNAQGQNFNQQYSLANLGLNAVGQAGQYGSSYGNNAGGYAIGRGNATAAGQAGAGAAWGGTLSGLGNLGLGYGIYGATSRPQYPSQQGLM